jgi:hypothetical protein
MSSTRIEMYFKTTLTKREVESDFLSVSRIGIELKRGIRSLSKFCSSFIRWSFLLIFSRYSENL